MFTTLATKKAAGDKLADLEKNYRDLEINCEEITRKLKDALGDMSDLDERLKEVWDLWYWILLADLWFYLSLIVARNDITVNLDQIENLGIPLEDRLNYPHFKSDRFR